MTNKRVLLLITAIVLVLAASGAFARSWFDTGVKSDHADRVQQYQMLNANAQVYDDTPDAQQGVVPRRSLAGPASTAGSPGAVIDNTYDDWQGTYMGHHVDWRGRPYVQFSYVDRQLGPGGVGQHGYNGFNPITGLWPQGQGVGCVMQTGEDGGLYPQLDVRSNGRVVMAGHQVTWTAGVLNDNVTWYQGTTPFTCVFGQSVIDSSQYNPGMMKWTATNLFRPDSTRLYQVQVELQERGSDTITHLISHQAPINMYLTGKTALTVTPILYFRKLTFSAGAAWVGPTIIDTVNRMAHLCASRTSDAVAVVYLKYTAEAATNTQFPAGNASDEAVYYRASADKGATWGAKTNITPFNRVAAESYSPWVEAKALYDSNGKLHIIYNATKIPKDPYGQAFTGWTLFVSGSSLFHWSDVTGTTSRIYNSEWDTSIINNPAFCGWVGFNNLNTGGFSISECNGHLYVVWTQSADPDGNPPVFGDCASGGVSSSVHIANGELFLSVSSDLSGLLWDNHRNITNTRTPNCDSAGFGGVCYSDNKATMSRYGMDITTFDTNSIPVVLQWPDTGVNPGPGAYTGNHWLHVQYLEDQYPGQKVLETPGNTYGLWKLNALKWMRLACVAPVTAAQIAYNPKTFGYSTKDWTKHGKPDTTTITLQNDGNAQLTTNIFSVKLDHTGQDWLGTTVAALNVDAGTSNIGTFGVVVNKGGIINTPGTIVALNGLVYLKTNVASPKDSVNVTIVNFLVADTLVGLKWDTVTTGCTRLIVSNNGDVGKLGAGTVNMDYVALGGDCVTTATVYAYDGGPIVIRKSGSNYIYSNALFQGDFVTEQSFKPFAQGPAASTLAGPGYDGFYTGTFVNKDTTIGVRRTYYAPSAGTDTCNFVIQKSVFFGLGGAKTNVTVGEVIDFDIPSYSGSLNDGRVLGSKNVTYQQGLDTSTTRCLKHNRRFGTVAFLGMYTPAEFTGNACANDLNFYGQYVMLNDTLFKYDTLTNTAEGSYFWNQMGGFTGLTAASTQAKDMHTVLTYKHNIASLDTLTVYTAVVSVKDGDTTTLKAGLDKARKWYLPHLRNCPAGNCCTDNSIDGRTGNVDADPAKGVDISDLSALIDFLYISFNPPACLLSANIDGDIGGGIDISDLSALIDYLYINFTLPANCPD